MMTTIPSLTLIDKRRTTKPPAEGLAPTWRDAKACTGVDPEVFFPGQGQTATRAKAICASCPVITECRTEAMTPPYEAFGVWGGLSEQDRENMRRRATPPAKRRRLVPGTQRHAVLAAVAKAGTWRSTARDLASVLDADPTKTYETVANLVRLGLMAGDGGGHGRPYTSLTLTDEGREHLARLEAAS